MNQLSIIPIENGPLEISNLSNKTLKNIIFYDSLPITLEKSTFICRCGKSKNQPFCDGTHLKNNFNSQKELKEEIIQVYNSKDVTVTFNRSICAGSAQCVKEFPTIYSSESSQDWINLDTETTEEIIKSIEGCPSSALSYSIEDKQIMEDYKKENIHILKNGPINVIGQVNLKIEHWSSFANKTKFTLCRCGASENKPFCDYSHASLKDDSYTF
jgi:CDGSH-type Zn-finger protein